MTIFCSVLRILFSGQSDIIHHAAQKHGVKTPGAEAQQHALSQSPGKSIVGTKRDRPSVPPLFRSDHRAEQSKGNVTKSQDKRYVPSVFYIVNFLTRAFFRKKEIP